MTDYRPRWRPTVMGRLIEWAKWHLRDRREMAYAAVTVIVLVTVIMLLAACQAPLRTIP